VDRIAYRAHPSYPLPAGGGVLLLDSGLRWNVSTLHASRQRCRSCTAVRAADRPVQLGG